MNVGFIGLGGMGSGMATNLVKAGHAVTVYNRTPDKAEPLVRAGAKQAATIAAACQGDAVFTMLANDSAVEAVVFGEAGIIESLAPGAVHISSSTISVDLAERLDAAHGETGQRFVAAPVLGRPDAAATGHLFVAAAGKPAALQDVAPLLAAIGQKTFIISDSPKTANIVKLSVNFLMASAIEALGEAMVLVVKGGVDAHRYVELLTATLFGAPVYQIYGALLADKAFEPAGFSVVLGAKDIGLVLGAAADLRVPLPFASLLHDHFLTLLANGDGGLDWSAVGALAAKNAGLAAS
jgi:3-hydroxyisobutyrate dehydrogenase-like beta-hydroxyacid dehydrogenase